MEVASEPTPPFLKYWWLHTWKAFWAMRVRGRIRGALRVLFGQSASIPKGLHDTAVGPMRVRDYYGGCKLSMNGGDIYWTPDALDGWGAGPGQDLFETAKNVPTREWPK